MNTGNARAAGIGMIAGMRSMSAPALATHLLSNRKRDQASSPVVRFMSQAKIARFFAVAAAGELVGDKLPFIPSRTDPGPLCGRAMFGAISAYAVDDGTSPFVSGTLGLAAAVISAFTFYHLRKKAGEETKLADPLWGVIEDLLVLLVACGIAQSYKNAPE